MTLTDNEIADVARVLAKRLFVLGEGGVATSNVTELKAAIQKIDQGMEATTTQLATSRPNTVLKTAFYQEVLAVAPNMTAQQGGIALALWALNEVGLIDVAGG